MFAGCYPMIIPGDQAELSDQSGHFHTSHPEGSKIVFPKQRIMQVWETLTALNGARILAPNLHFSLPVMICGETERRGFATTPPFAQAAAPARKRVTLGARGRRRPRLSSRGRATLRAGGPAPAGGPIRAHAQ
jgi:hypothetical protein